MTAERTTARRGGPGSTRRFLRDLAVIVVVALLASFLIRTFLVRSFFIPSASMEPTLLGEPGHHDRILVDELVPRLVPIRRGDVVVFTDPGGWLGGEQTASATPSTPVAEAADALLSLVGLSTRDSDDHLVKRVIGLPGDHVACCDPLGRVTVDGAPLDEPYTRLPAGTRLESRVPFDVVVRPGDLWVMGDNRWDSADSRYHQGSAEHGGVPTRDVVGRASVVSWPVDRWRWIDDYPATFAGVPSSSR
ncbi:signal peptidase I [Amnibacterium kyonggiense]|uniref:Signal peptidase I n=1 Tax=Amnibacterium kyonggiense TaxID=595671 RepID=A0A4R7FKK1_9MICO|nr:signal peptidase I [Amnibacterium kyonggiense]TDS76911.1 signal peptidase I [Amnibacterium kyonggiense]